MIRVGETIHWWIRSTENPLWNCEGMATITKIGGGPPSDVVNKMYELEMENGEKPDDLTWGYNK